MDSDKEVRQTGNDPESAAFLPLLILMFCPMIAGILFGDFVDWTGLKDFKNSDSIEDSFRSLLYSIGALVVAFISLSTIFNVVMYGFRNIRGTREGLPLLWKDDYGNDIPEQPEPIKEEHRRPMRKETKRKINKGGYVTVLLMLAAISISAGLLFTQAYNYISEFFEYDTLVETGDVMQYAVVALEILLFIAVMAIMLGVYHWYFMYYGAWKELARYFPKIPEDDPYYVSDDSDDDDSKED